MKTSNIYLLVLSLLLALVFPLVISQATEILNVRPCNNYYKYTAFPNIFNHKNQEEALFHLHTFMPLVGTFCADNLFFLTCLVHFPSHDSLKSSVPKPPCRSLCQRVLNKCAYAMNQLQFYWPDIISCDKFPNSTTGCYTDDPRIRFSNTTTTLRPSCAATESTPMCNVILALSDNRTFFAETNQPFTNYFKHTSQAVAIYELSRHATLLAQLSQLQKTLTTRKEAETCRNNLLYLLCTLHTPRCGRKTPSEYLIRKSDCEETLGKTCETSISLIRSKGYVVQWPPVSVDCSVFPDRTDEERAKSHFFKPTSIFEELSPAPPAVRAGINGSVFLEVKWSKFPAEFSAGLQVQTGLLYKLTGSKTSFIHVHAKSGQLSVLLTNLTRQSSYDVFVTSVNNYTRYPGIFSKLQLKTVDGIEQLTMKFCSDFYNFTGFPNVFGDKDQTSAIQHMFTFFPLLDTMCSSDLKALMCSAFLPRYSSSQKVIQKPCQSLCKNVLERCGYAINRLKFKWPQQLSCEKLPSEPASCYKPTRFIDVTEEEIESKNCVKTAEQSICSLVRTSQNQPYFRTVDKSFSNYFNHKSQDQAVYELSEHGKLLSLLAFIRDPSPTPCIQKLSYLLCNLHLPNCGKGVRVTKEDCKMILNGERISPCGPLVDQLRRTGHVIDWPPVRVDCDSFPTNLTYDHKFGPATFNDLIPPPVVRYSTSHPGNLTLSYSYSTRFGDPSGYGVLYKPINSVTTYMQFHFAKAAIGSTTFKLPTLNKNYDVFIGAVNPKTGSLGRLNRLTYVFGTTVSNLPIRLDLCYRYYQNIILPNRFGDGNLVNATMRMSSFFPLVYTLCSDEITPFLCSVVFPRFNRRYLPCRSVCERIYSGCSYAIKRSRFYWPPELSCDKFSNGESCYDITELATPSGKVPLPALPRIQPQRRAAEQCQNVQPNLICAQVILEDKSRRPYFSTMIPFGGQTNYFNHASKDEAIYKLSRYLPLLSYLWWEGGNDDFVQCVRDLTVLLCHLHVPVCPVNPLTITQSRCHAILDAKSPCQRAILTLQRRGVKFNWPLLQVNCSDSKWFANSSSGNNYIVDRPTDPIPPPPTAIRLMSRSLNKLSFIYFPNRNGFDLQYGVLYRQNGSVEPYKVSKPFNPGPITINQLGPGKTYEVKFFTFYPAILPGVFTTVTEHTYIAGTVDIPSRIDICRKYYSKTVLPNRYGDGTIEQATSRMYTFFPLVYTLCSEDLTPFLCSVYLPRYDDVTNVQQLPCRSVCQKIFKSCSYAIARSRFHWPAEMRCDTFDDSSSCYNVSARSKLLEPDIELGEAENGYRVPRSSSTIQCKPIPPNLICSAVLRQTDSSPYFNSTFSGSHSNYFSHTSTDEAIYELSRFLPLLSSLLWHSWPIDSTGFVKCAEQLTVLLCHLHIPLCPHNTRTINQSLCHQIFSNSSSCFTAINKLQKQKADFEWPPVKVNCSDEKWFSKSSSTDYKVSKFPSMPPPPPTSIGIRSRSSTLINVQFTPMRTQRNLATGALYRQNNSIANYSMRTTTWNSLGLQPLEPEKVYEVKLATLSEPSGAPGPFVTITGRTYGRCPNETTGDNLTQGEFFWLAQNHGQSRAAKCPYGNIFGQNIPKANFEFEGEHPERILSVGLLRRFCQCNDTVCTWSKANTDVCNYKTFNDSMVTQQLSDLLQELQKDENSAVNVSESLVNITRIHGPEFQPDDVTLTTLILEALVELTNSLNETGPNIVKTVDNLLNALDLVLAESQEISKSSTRTLLVLTKYLENVPIADGENITQNEPNLAVYAQEYDETNFKGAAAASLNELKSVKPGDNFVVYNNENSVQPPVSQVSLTLPKSLFEKLQLNEEMKKQRIIFVVYRKTPLFQSLRKNTSNAEAGTVRKKNSLVIAGSVKGHKLQDLKDPVVSTYYPLERAVDESSACVFWDFSLNNDFGDWSKVGCSYQGTKDGFVTCHCQHLTNFAILMDVYIDEGIEPVHKKALSIISYIGCAISLVGLKLTILTILIFKELRTKAPTQILLNFCIALSLTLIVFLAAAERSKTSSLCGCRAAAIALHYFVLATFMWMAIEAYNMYLAFVKVMPKHYSRFMLKCCIAGWGLPAVIVIVTAAVAIEEYGDEHFCRLQGLPFQVAFLAPVLLILVINSIAFFLILRSLLTSGKKVTADKRASGLQQARRGAAILVVLGLTWLFGILAVKEAKLVFQYLFCIFNSIQGLLVFIFYCVLSIETRRKYQKLFGKNNAKDTETGHRRHNESSAESRFREIKSNPRSTSDTSGTKMTSTTQSKDVSEMELQTKL